MALSLDFAKADMTKYFDRSRKHVYTSTELASTLAENRDRWDLARSTTLNTFTAFLVEKTKLREVRLYSKTYPALVRYAWAEPSPYELGLSIRHGAYLSHGTAVFLHNLTDKVPTTIYVNREQSIKPRPNSLSQEALNRAFSARQRRSNYILEHGNWRYVILSGKNTGRLGVHQIKGFNGETLECTGLERTLIDIVVRPAYAGGVYEVLDAFRAARARVSTEKLKGLLKKLDYVYPYHQAVGFYMQRAGYDQNRYSQFQKLGLNYDFYLANNLVDPDYSEEWRLFFPKGF